MRRLFFSGPLRNALARKYPRLRARRVLEDNDPGGYLSGKVIAAKKEMPKYAKFHIPKRSPDLSVLDYYFWNEVGRRLRKAELLFPEDKKEARDDFIIRLKKTALSIPPADVSKAIGDLA